MFSAGDSSGEGVNSLNQFSNIHGTVDWAALAQQWIQMRDTNTNLVGMPDAPPPPNISGSYNNLNKNSTTIIKKTLEEKGEADMEMEDDDENTKREDSPTPPAPSMHIKKTAQQPAPWYTQQQGLMQSKSNMMNSEIGVENGLSHSTIAAPPWNVNVWPPRMNLPPPPTILPTAQLTVPAINPTAHIPSLMKINVPIPNTMKINSNIEDENSTTVPMDAAKRKILPAWIREGLEKMEREKQKQMEKKQQSSSKEAYDVPDITKSGLAQTVKAPNTAILESDSSGNEDDEPQTVAVPKLAQKTDAGDEQSGVSGTQIETDGENQSDEQSYVIKRSYEEKLSDLMIVVRTTLTELLLEVTNEEIAAIAQEAVNSRKSKASSAQVIRKSALTSITSKLGLAAYDDSTSDGSGSESEASDKDLNHDSEEDIKASIRLKRRAFAKISEEIEERIAASAAREEQKLKYYTQIEREDRHDGQQKDDTEHSAKFKGASTSNTTPATTVSKAYERDFGETTETKLQHSNGIKQKERISRKERTTRFSDNKDSKSASMAAAAAATYISKLHSSSSSTISIANQNTSVPLFPITTSSTSTVTSPTDSTNILNMTECLTDGSSLNKNLLNAAEAAFEKITKLKSSASSSSEKHHRSRPDHGHNKDRERDRMKNHERSREGERERHSSRRSREHYSTDDEPSSFTTDSSSTTSDSSKYSRTSSTKHQRTESVRSSRSHKRSRSRSFDRHYRRKKNHTKHYDDDKSYYRHSSSRHSSKSLSKSQRSRSRSRSTYSSSSRKHKH